MEALDADNAIDGANNQLKLTNAQKDEYEKIKEGKAIIENQKVQRKALIDRMVDQLVSLDSFFMDMKLVVLEVPYMFPTGFFIQEVSQIYQKEISGARF